MSHGLQVFTAAGLVLFDSDRPLWRFLEAIPLTYDVSGSKSYAGVQDVEAVAAFIMGGTFSAYGHKITIVGATTVAWEAFNIETWIYYPNSPQVLMVFSR